MDDLDIVELETADRTNATYYLTLAVYNGRVFFFSVTLARWPFASFDVQFPITNKGA